MPFLFISFYLEYLFFQLILFLIFVVEEKMYTSCRECSVFHIVLNIKCSPFQSFFFMDLSPGSCSPLQ